MESEDHHHPLVRGHAKPLCYSQNQEMIVVGEASNELLLINKHDPSQYFRVPTGKTDKTIGLKLTDKLLVRAGVEGNVTLWDSRELRSATTIHTFNRPGCKFNALDISEHILAGGASKRIVFWDLRKMKQRCEYTESFNQDVTSLQFSKEAPTSFYTATYDGLISKFDLTQKDQQDAFVWGHQIVESPCYLQNSGNITLIQTQDQMLLTLEEQSVRDKFTVSNIDNPRHILNSHLNTQRQIVYYTKHMRKGTVEYWNGQTNIGHIPITTELEMLVPLSQEKVLYADERGNWFFERVHKGKAQKSHTVNQDFLTVEELQSNVGKPEKKKEMNENGFIVNKPSSLKNNSKKFKPY